MGSFIFPRMQHDTWVFSRKRQPVIVKLKERDRLIAMKGRERKLLLDPKFHPTLGNSDHWPAVLWSLPQVGYITAGPRCKQQLQACRPLVTVTCCRSTLHAATRHPPSLHHCHSPAPRIDRWPALLSFLPQLHNQSQLLAMTTDLHIIVSPSY